MSLVIPSQNYTVNTDKLLRKALQTVVLPISDNDRRTINTLLKVQHRAG